MAYVSARKMVGGGLPLLRENLAEIDPSPSNTSIFNQHSVRCLRAPKRKVTDFRPKFEQ